MASTRRNVGNTYGKGMTLSKAHKDASSAAMKGKGKPKAKAHKDAISAALKGKGKPKAKAHKAAIMITCIRGVCKTCKGRARQGPCPEVPGQEGLGGSSLQNRCLSTPPINTGQHALCPALL